MANKVGLTDAKIAGLKAPTAGQIELADGIVISQGFATANPKSQRSSDPAARKLMIEDGLREHEPPPITGPDLGDMEM